MTLIQAIRSNEPFRRPSWVDENSEYKWVVYNEKYDMFDWANDDGTSSDNVFGDLQSLVSNNHLDANDYEVMT